MDAALCVKNRNQKDDVAMHSSSSNSTFEEDTTPSDSGVQMLDSELSELMAESISSQMGFEFEENKQPQQQQEQQQMQHLQANSNTAVDTNSNVTTAQMQASICSTFDATENIVYRRKARKSAAALTKAPKKRVSFHEDILKNKRTDNIRVEHGFVTYKNGRKMLPYVVNGAAAGRYSWCAEGTNAEQLPTELCDDDDAETGYNHEDQRKRIVYRNACSDVLDYGNSDIYDTNESNYLQYDNSGVFEYMPKDATNTMTDKTKAAQLQQYFCTCSCSSSDSSIDAPDNNSNRQQNYAQAKSNSCDCIGNSRANNNIIGDNCYYSDPNIDNIQTSPSPLKKFVWNKEQKPKSSCLKKTAKRHTHVIHEQNLQNRMKKFNVHDMNQLLDNSSKMLFGSLKSIFTMPLPERGVPEGSEDLHAVTEAFVSDDQKATNASGSPTTLKSKPFISKSLDGSKQQKTFVHNVDEQLRRKQTETATPLENNATNKTNLQRQQEIDENDEATAAVAETTTTQSQIPQTQQFRNKFIINCESTVFEHTGVSYCYEYIVAATGGSNSEQQQQQEQQTPIGKPLSGSFMSAPIAKTFSNFFRSLKDNKTETLQEQQSAAKQIIKPIATQQQAAIPSSAESEQYLAKIMQKQQKDNISQQPNATKTAINSFASTNVSSPTTDSQSSISGSNSKSSLPMKQNLRNNLDKQSRHLPSPLKSAGIGSVTPRYATATAASIVEQQQQLHNCGRDSKSTILSEEFDDILTITTDADRNESDIVIVDYAELHEQQQLPTAAAAGAAAGALGYGNLLKPAAAKASLINRFLRNVTQKKMLENSMRRNDFFAQKLKQQSKQQTPNLYVSGVSSKNYELIDDLNAEIAMEIEMSGVNSPRRELASIQSDLPDDMMTRFEMGVGEVCIDLFNGNGNCLNFLRSTTEELLKVFKLYTGYGAEGFMTPVLVFLTDKALYVTDLVRNQLCRKFVLDYADLDVILMGPFGNTVLLSNSLRDLQQVLLAGGAHTADALVANLELCARRSGCKLPAVGQLTLTHLNALQAFVRANSSVGKHDAWMYYAVVNVPASTLGLEQEPLGPHIKGFLMHRRIRVNSLQRKQQWHPGYFLLKAGVLYMFNDSMQKLPSWAMALAECQGARRTAKAERPHCFEIMLKGQQLLQLAAPDEYVASEWLQALLQAASGLFEMQEKHKSLGCTLVVTENHLITLREDFTAPLRQLNNANNNSGNNSNVDSTASNNETLNNFECSSSLLSSAMSSPTKCAQPFSFSINSTPSKLSQVSRSTLTDNTLNSPMTSSCNISINNRNNKGVGAASSSMSSIYGLNSGLEILTCADIKELTGIKIPAQTDTWWCIIEFSCQEVRECSDDLIVFFASSTEMQRFLRLLEQQWQQKNNDLFPITVLDEDEQLAEQCTLLHMDINRAWEPLLTAALGYPL